MAKSPNPIFTTEESQKKLQEYLKAYAESEKGGSFATEPTATGWALKSTEKSVAQQKAAERAEAARLGNPDPYAHEAPKGPAVGGEMDPSNQLLLDKWTGELGRTGEFEENLRRQLSSQVLQSGTLESAIGQTTQAMGSRGQGRVAQMQHASELDTLAQLNAANIEAAKAGHQVAMDASTQIQGVMAAHMEQQAKIHEWTDNDRTYMSNQYNELITSMQNVVTDLISSGHLTDDDSWQKFGVVAKMIVERFAAATTDEERERIKAEAFGTVAEYHDTVAGLQWDAEGNLIETEASPAAPNYPT